MNIQEQEERDFVVATDTDWDRAEAHELGAADPEQAWVCTDRDVWHANPFYQGPPVPHPEDDYAHGYDPADGIPWPVEQQSDADYEAELREWEDDIPF